MSVLCYLRDVAECAGSDERHQQPLAENIVEPRERENDERDRRHPVVEALEGVVANDMDRRAFTHIPLRAAQRVQQYEHEQGEEDGGAQYPWRPPLMKLAPGAALRLLQIGQLPIGNADTADDARVFAQQHLLGYRLARRQGRRRGRGLLLCHLPELLLLRGRLLLGVGRLEDQERRRRGERENTKPDLFHGALVIL